MERIYDADIIEVYLKENRIRNHFDTEKLSFYLARYEKGELLVQPMQRLHSLLFVISGTVSLYSIREDGSVFVMSSDDEFVLLGDMEFVNEQLTVFYAEARTDVLAVCLPIGPNRVALNQDVCFLHYLLDSLAWKMHQAAVNESSFLNLEERFLHYLTFRCPNQLLTHVKYAADNLHCSRRQLQRVLKKLVDEGKVVKIGKGTYRLNSENIA